MTQRLAGFAVCLLWAGCQSAGDRPLVSTSHVEIRVSPSRVEGEHVVLDSLVIEPKGGARITEATVIVFDDVNGNGRPDSAEWSDTLVSRPQEPGGIQISNSKYPRGQRLVAEIQVRTDDGLPLMLRWAVLDVRPTGS